ncbi:formate dehydrogenase subunit gamma [Shimia abyssi]|uniref:Formate dehydrogenase gamma subunit n=1 Tax=Shimia abyssi TaxID=1662395 RepID=A0A2P8FAI1_9RHOB|nr:formate dehydrogenase subunit gamma [Shimia abyssi]PSL18719.1 formate dehydrogenase gamma subunit [Shimia abyssi]
MTRLRLLLSILTICLVSTMGVAQEATGSNDTRAATGGAQTLEDIMARQRGEKIDDTFRRDATGQANVEGLIGQLGTRGVASDSEVYRALRYGSATTSTSARGPVAGVLIQDNGMTWLTFREGPLLKYGFYALGGMLAVILLFFLLRGKIRIDGEKTGRKITRFVGIERFAHWTLGISFILLALTGLFLIAGRNFIMPWMGKEAYATIALAGKWVHNNVAWAFMIALVMVFVMWVVHNIPNMTDLRWLAKGGGLFSKGVHPPAHKFNAGQKIIFWSVILLGFSISLSGLSLLFPFEIPTFAKTFVILNATGLPELIMGTPLPEVLSPYQEMQYSQAWHAIVAFAFIMIVIAHIYLGSVGMEGAFDAMGTGDVEEQWAKEHHSLWYEKEMERTKSAPDQATPAE